MLTIRKKQNVIKEVQVHDGDTGSAQVQVGLLTKQIDELAKHLKGHLKDNSSRRGLLKMVSKRRKLLDYLAKNDEKSYAKVVKKLGLKK
ncbi:MAG: 30S ribosomal protein S15 [Candidatus Paceibacterota bacterium]|jgi:small subunit ribosomal protein S15